MKLFANSMTFALVVGTLAVFASSSTQADDGQFAKKHPRRAQVLKRDKKLNNKTQRAAKNGKITDAQAQHLENQEADIKKQEQADAAANGGHITKSEQRDLNREENGVHHELRHDERKDARNGTTPASAGAPPAGAGAPATPPSQ